MMQHAVTLRVTYAATVESTSLAQVLAFYLLALLDLTGRVLSAVDAWVDLQLHRFVAWLAEPAFYVIWYAERRNGKGMGLFWGRFGVVWA